MSWEDEVKEKRVALRKQNREVRTGTINGAKITCGGCGKLILLVHTYKCYFCRLWFCWTCAGHHFKKPSIR